VHKKFAIKMLSGFGGCNIALRFSVYNNVRDMKQPSTTSQPPIQGHIAAYCSIRQGEVRLNGERIFSAPEVLGDINRDSFSKNTAETAIKMSDMDFLTAIYEFMELDYRKFFKMDMLSKLGFLASEIILKGTNRETPKPDTGIALFNTHSSLEADSKFFSNIRNPADYFPSPSEFVYTLPNIVAGEIALRNKIHGETAFYCARNLLSAGITDITKYLLTFAAMKRVITGWVDVDPIGQKIDCLMFLVESVEHKSDDATAVGNGVPFTEDNVLKIDLEAQHPESKTVMLSTGA
jgi:hypothetical protein